MILRDLALQIAKQTVRSKVEVAAVLVLAEVVGRLRGQALALVAPNCSADVDWGRRKTVDRDAMNSYNYSPLPGRQTERPRRLMPTGSSIWVVL